MDGIFSKNLIELKSSDKNKVKENIENFLKSNSDSTTFSDDYLYIYNQLKNPQSTFFSKPLMDEINYVSIKGGDFFGAFTNTEKKVDYLLNSNSPFFNNGNNTNKKSTNNAYSFGIPLLNEKIQVNKTASLALKKNIEDEFEKYLALYPEEPSNGFADGFGHEAAQQKNLNSNINYSDFTDNNNNNNLSLNKNNDYYKDNHWMNSAFGKKDNFCSNNLNRFDNALLLEDDLNLPLSENEDHLAKSTSK